MAIDLSMLDGHLPNVPLGPPGAAALAPLSSFEEDPDNPRFEDDPMAFDLLVADMRQRGVLQPVIVRRLSNGKLRIRFGARRYRAALKLGLAAIPYVVTEDARQFDDYAQVAENQRRSPMQPLELAVFAAKKIAAGDKKNLVAEKLGLHPSALTHLLCLTGDVPSFLLELYHSGKCRSAHYLYQVKGLWLREPALVEQMCAAAGEIDLRCIQGLATAVQEQQAREALPPEEAKASGPAVPDGDGPRAAPAAGRAGGAKRVAPPSRSVPGAGQHAGPLERRRAWPQLFGEYQGRAVQLDLFAAVSADGMLHARFLDTDAVAEVQARAVVLVRVTQMRPGS